MTNDNQPAPIPNSSKPKWLRRLERESWQAELVISGASIFGSLQLPALMDQLEYYMLLNFERFSLELWLLVVLYLRLVALGLIIVFLFHFIIRALWIGLVGLNSVFPGGIRTTKRFSLDFQGKLKKDYGDVDGLIMRLDQLGSAVFGIGFAAVFIFLNLGLIGAILITMVNYIQDIEGLAVVSKVLLVFLFIMIASVSIMHLPFLQDKAWVKRIHYPITKVFYRVLFPLNNKYTIMAINLVSYHFADRKGYWVYMMVISIAVGFRSASMVTQNTNSRYFADKYYHRIANDSTRIYPSAYADSEHDGIYFRPLIPSSTLSNNQQLPVWIPLPDRELQFMYEQCSVPEPSENLENPEKRQANRVRALSCAREYIEISINGQAIQNYKLKQFCQDISIGCQFGMQAMIFDPPLRKGENLLQVTTHYPHKDDGRDRVAYIPFYF